MDNHINFKQLASFNRVIVDSISFYIRLVKSVVTFVQDASKNNEAVIYINMAISTFATNGRS